MRSPRVEMELLCSSRAGPEPFAREIVGLLSSWTRNTGSRNATGLSAARGGGIRLFGAGSGSERVRTAGIRPRSGGIGAEKRPDKSCPIDLTFVHYYAHLWQGRRAKSTSGIHASVH